MAGYYDEWAKGVKDGYTTALRDIDVSLDVMHRKFTSHLIGEELLTSNKYFKEIKLIILKLNEVANGRV